MNKLLQTITILIVTLFFLLYFLDGLEYSEAEKEWCMEQRTYLPINVCAKEFGY